MGTDRHEVRSVHRKKQPIPLRSGRKGPEVLTIWSLLQTIDPSSVVWLIRDLSLNCHLPAATTVRSKPLARRRNVSVDSTAVGRNTQTILC